MSLRSIDARCCRVAILGAESSGKSTLAAALAARYQTLWVPEYLREFVEAHQRVPRPDEQFGIASMQVERERQSVELAGRYLFCDTTPLMTSIYSGYYFGGADVRLAALAASHGYDVTLVTAPDSPWEADGLQRESEQVRQTIHGIVLRELAVRGTAYHLVEGPLAQRVQQVALLLP